MRTCATTIFGLQLLFADGSRSVRPERLAKFNEAAVSEMQEDVMVVSENVDLSLLETWNRTRPKGKPKPPYRMRMENSRNVQYTGLLRVGGQELRGVFDTGSFELLVFSRQCGGCGNSSRLYNHSQSPHYRNGSLDLTHSFGSGSTTSYEAVDEVQIGHLVAPNQTFWEVVDAQMPVLRTASFQAIVGVGPPGSAAKAADKWSEDAVSTRASLLAEGRAVPTDITHKIESFSQAADLARSNLELTDNLGARIFSVCIGQRHLSPGYFIWNDHDPRFSPRVFTRIPMTSPLHWSVEMTDARLGASHYGDSKGIDLGCGGGLGSCGALFDTGTSLIAAPANAISRIMDTFERLGARNCSKISELPELRFNLGGFEFSLPPDSYVGRVTGQLPSALAAYTSHIKATHETSTEDTCQPLLMNTASDTEYGPMWILGLPFFRKYYTTFHSVLSKPTSVVESPQYKNSVFTAVADDDCKPTAAAVLLSTPRKSNVMTIDLSLLRVPDWARSP